MDPAVPWPRAVAIYGRPYGIPRLFDHPEMSQLHGPLLSITQDYQAIISKAEQYYQAAFRIAPEEAGKYKGRGQPMKTRKLPWGEAKPKETHLCPSSGQQV